VAIYLAYSSSRRGILDFELVRNVAILLTVNNLDPEVYGCDPELLWATFNLIYFVSADAADAAGARLKFRWGTKGPVDGSSIGFVVVIFNSFSVGNARLRVESTSSHCGNVQRSIGWYKVLAASSIVDRLLLVRRDLCG
jgi:hypothetical protein